jgi:hypothetical protein
VIGIHAAIADVVAAHGVVAETQPPPVHERALDRGDVLRRRGLELGSHGAHADGVAHAVDQAEGVLAEDASDLLERGRHGGTEPAGGGGSEQVAAHQEGG